MKWKDKLNEIERKHLRETGITTLKLLRNMRIHQAAIGMHCRLCDSIERKVSQ